MRILIFFSCLFVDAGFSTSAIGGDSASFTPPDVNIVSNGGTLTFYTKTNGPIANTTYGTSDYDYMHVTASLCGLSEVHFIKDLTYSIGSASYFGFAGRCNVYPPSIGSSSGDYSLQAYTAELNSYWEQAITACNLNCLIEQ